LADVEFPLSHAGPGKCANPYIWLINFYKRESPPNKMKERKMVARKNLKCQGLQKTITIPRYEAGKNVSDHARRSDYKT
jgi:hypothetical protein